MGTMGNKCTGRCARQALCPHTAKVPEQLLAVARLVQQDKRYNKEVIFHTSKGSGTKVLLTTQQPWSQWCCWGLRPVHTTGATAAVDGGFMSVLTVTGNGCSSSSSCVAGFCQMQ
jgi:hypothetical protein